MMMDNLKKFHVVLIVLVFILVIIVSYSNNKENFAGIPLSNESIQNISSVYANTKETVSVNNLNVTGTSNLMPKGGIIAWSGDENAVPLTWALCNGQNGTPDLRGRFILGVGQGAGLTNRGRNQTGGAEKHTLTIGEIPAHSHSGVPAYGHNCFKGGKCSGHHLINGWKRTDNEGGNQPHNIMPPFFVLAYIMKL